MSIKADLSNVEQVCVHMGWMKQFEKKGKDSKPHSSEGDLPTKPQYTASRGPLGVTYLQFDLPWVFCGIEV